MTYRNPSLLALARVAPHCMACGTENAGQVVAAHSNEARDGKGMSLKASDAACAFLCDICHTYVDQGSCPPGRAILKTRREAWEVGHYWTMRWLFESGHVVVRPADYVEPIHAPKPKVRVRKSRALPTGREFPKSNRPIAMHTDPWGRGKSQETKR